MIEWEVGLNDEDPIAVHADRFSVCNGGVLEFWLDAGSAFGRSEMVGAVAPGRWTWVRRAAEKVCAPASVIR